MALRIKAAVAALFMIPMAGGCAFLSQQVSQLDLRAAREGPIEVRGGAPTSDPGPWGPPQPPQPAPRAQEEPAPYAPSATSPSPQTAAAACDMNANASLIGRFEKDIDRSRLPPETRIVCALCTLSGPSSPDRLNLHLDRDGKVAALSCG